jgi:hypothetical protein
MTSSPPELQLLAKPFVPTQLIKVVEQTLEVAPHEDIY